MYKRISRSSSANSSTQEHRSQFAPPPIKVQAKKDTQMPRNQEERSTQSGNNIASIPILYPDAPIAPVQPQGLIQPFRDGYEQEPQQETLKTGIYEGLNLVQRAIHGRMNQSYPVSPIGELQGVYAIQRDVTFKRDEIGSDVTIPDYTPSGQEKIAVDEALGYISAGTAVIDQAWAKASAAANGGKIPGKVKGFKWGVDHRNLDGDLPGKKGAGGYKEYYVRKGDGTDSGAHPQCRIVISNADSKNFYTNTHYGRDGNPPFYLLKP